MPRPQVYRTPPAAGGINKALVREANARAEKYRHERDAARQQVADLEAQVADLEAQIRDHALREIRDDDRVAAAFTTAQRARRKFERVANVNEHLKRGK